MISAAIVSQPVSDEVLVGNYAHFYCVSDGTPIYWKLDGTDLAYSVLKGDTSEDNVGSDNRCHLTLSILGKIDYNGTEVQCATKNDQHVSDVAILSVKSRKSSLILYFNYTILTGIYVTNVTVSRNANSLYIQWELIPLNEGDVETQYQVLIQNVTDENKPFTVDWPSCVNTTETNCTFTSSFVGPCDKYVVTVFPFNKAVPGNSSQGLLGSEFNVFSLSRFLINLFSFKIHPLVYPTRGMRIWMVKMMEQKKLGP